MSWSIQRPHQPWPARLHSRQAWVNLSRHGSDEQMFGAKQQVLLGGKDD